METSPDREAERAVVASAAALGLDCRVVPCAYSLNGSRPLALELLASEDRPAAILCMSDSIAYGVYAGVRGAQAGHPRRRRRRGLRRSSDLGPAVAAADLDGAGTSSRSPAAPTEFLLAAIAADGPQATLREVVAPVLVARASTG